MRGRFARFASWGRKALVLAALLGVPALAAAPSAEAQVVQAVIVDSGAPAQLVPVQYGPPRGYYRGYYRGGPRYWRGPPRGYYRRHYAGRGYGPPPRFYRRGYR
jgi:hypothetical protein